MNLYKILPLFFRADKERTTIAANIIIIIEKERKGLDRKIKQLKYI